MHAQNEDIELLKKIILAWLYINGGIMPKEKLKALSFLTYKVIKSQNPAKI